MLGKNPNEFPKLPSPQVWADPDRIRFKELYKFQSVDMKKIADSIKNYKKSIGYISGILVGCLLFKGFVDQAAQLHVFGENGNGGTLLEMTTTNTTYDYYYNRHFQRMRYLTEDPQNADPYARTRDELLVDLGAKYIPQGNNFEAHKRAPHYKYF